MNPKQLYRSNVNIDGFLLVLFLIWIFYNVLLLNINGKNYLIGGLSIALVYLGLYLLVNICYFYKDHIEVIYLFRIRNRKIKYNYEQIYHIKYFATVSRFEPPTLKIYIKDDTKKDETFSFPLRFYKKRRAILRHLKSKGIPIRIDSVLEKDYRIFTPPVKMDKIHQTQSK